MDEYEKTARAVVELVTENVHQSDQLTAAATILDALEWSHFGMETIDPPHPGAPALHYLNTGDTYSVTVAQEADPENEFEFDAKGPIFVTSWGDWVEEQENEHTTETNEIRCGYCGEWTPCAKDWRETTCKSCNHNVSTGEPAE